MNIIKCKSTLGKEYLQHRIKLKTDTVDIKAMLYKKLNKLKESVPVTKKVESIDTIKAIQKKRKPALEIKIRPKK